MALIFDLSAALRATEDFGHIFRRVQIESWRQQAVILIENTQALTEDEHPYQLKCLRNLIENHKGMMILAGNDPAWASRSGLTKAIAIPIEMPDYAERYVLWQRHLKSPNLSESGLEILAQRFRLTPSQIAAACQTAKAQARWESAVKNNSALNREETTLESLMLAARAQSDQALATLARKVTLNYRWHDLILPENQFAQLQEICLQFTHRHIVYDDWGFGRKLSLGRARRRAAEDRHVVGKAHTVAVERDNSNTRHHLGRMTRRTKVVSKKDEMVYDSIKLWCALTTPDIFRQYQNTFNAIFT